MLETKERERVREKERAQFLLAAVKTGTRKKETGRIKKQEEVDGVKMLSS